MNARLHELDGGSLFANKGLDRLEALQGINFSSLDLSGNKIKVISELNSSINSLNLRFNPIVFIDAIPVNTYTLFIDSSPYLENLDALTNLSKISTLVVNNCPSVTELDLSQSSISVLEFDETPIEKISTSWSMLVSLYGNGFEIPDFKKADTPRLHTVALTYSNMDIVKNNPNHYKFGSFVEIPNNYDLSYLKESSWDHLKIEGKGIKEIEFLRGISIKSLSLSGNSIRDLSPLADSFTLTHLNIDATDVDDLTPLRELDISSFSGEGLTISQGKCPIDARSEALRKYCVERN